MDDCDEPLILLEEHSVSEVDSGEIHALITNLETLSNTTGVSCPIDEEEAVRTLVTWSLDRTLTWSNETAISARVPIRQHQISSRFAEGRDASAVVLQQGLPRTSPSQAKVLVTKEDISASRKTKTLDELLLEIQQLSQERASPVSHEPDEEEETSLPLHEPRKAIIDTGCGQCVTGALTLEAHHS